MRPFDPNANTIDRLRRNMQKLNKGAIVSTIPAGTFLAGNASVATTAPLTGGAALSTNPTLGLSIFTPGGLSTVSGGLSVILSSTSGSTMLADYIFSTVAASTNVYTLGGNGSTWWTSQENGQPQIPSSTLNSTCMWVTNGYAQAASTTANQTWFAQYVPTLTLGSHYQVSLFGRVDNGVISGNGAAIGLVCRLPAIGSTTSSSGVCLMCWADGMWLYDQGSGTPTFKVSTAVTAGGSDHTFMLDVNGNTFSLYFDGVFKTSTTITNNAGQVGTGFFAGSLTRNAPQGIKEWKVSSIASAPIYSGLILDSHGLRVLPDPAGGLAISSSGVGIQLGSTGSTLLSTVIADGVDLVTQNSTTVFAGPTSGAAAAPTFRALTSTDIPALGPALTSTGVLPVVSADPGSPADGQAWYNSTAAAVRVREKGVTLGGWFLFDGLTANGTIVVNTLTKTATFTSRVLPANWWSSRAAVRCSYHGQYSNSTATTLAIDFAVSTSAGITSLSGNSVFTAAAPANAANFGGTLLAMCRTTGSTGTFSLQGDYLFDNTTHTFAPAFQQPTLDTTKDWVFLLMLTWNAANVNNTAQATDCVLELCNAPY